MSFGLRIRPAADEDVTEIASYIAQDNVDSALRFLEAFRKTLRLIQEHPRRSPRFDLRNRLLRNLRKRAVAGFEHYLVFFLVDGEMVDVLRVLHGARDLPSILDR